MAGPTASGKTALAIELAQYYKSEILSADSRQFFREMNIGTAKPTADELAAAPHHFINSLSIQEEYTIGDFERDALAWLDRYYEKNDIAILAGGSGMYIKALCEGLDDFPKVDKEIRIELKALLDKEGLAVLQAELEASDPNYYQEADIQNPQRVIRALEICRGTGKPFSSFRDQKNTTQRSFEVIKLGINWERPILYDRINLRVDLMMKEGLLEEARQLYSFRNLNALQTVGYQEFFAHFEEEHSLEKAIELVKRNSRRYAKRQMTWFRKETTMHWITPNTPFADTTKWLDKKMTSGTSTML